ncbi:MAG: hypothetical protein NTV94_19300 [Planctomycetota bacterium]|nr:hypothetical protein [Planctomycetota bacterium]
MPRPRFITHGIFAATALTVVGLSLLTLSKWRVVQPPAWIDRVLAGGDIGRRWPTSLADVIFVVDIKSGQVRQQSLSMSGDSIIPLVMDPSVRSYEPTLAHTNALWGLLTFWQHTATYAFRFAPMNPSVSAQAIEQDWEAVRPKVVELLVREGMEASFAQRLCAGPGTQVSSQAVHTTLVGFIIHDVVVLLLALSGLRSARIAVVNGRRWRLARLRSMQICAGCGYDLSGTPDATGCSECGRLI